MDLDPFCLFFVCFAFQLGSLLCDRPVSGNNRLVKFALQIFMIFLILVTCKNKATSDSFLEQSRVILSQAGRARYIVICINPAFTKIIDRTEKTKIPSKFAKRCKFSNTTTTARLGDFLRQLIAPCIDHEKKSKIVSRLVSGFHAVDCGFQSLPMGF